MQLNENMTLTRSDIRYLEQTFITKEDFQETLKSALLATKSDLIDKLDSILKEILASREEETILSHRVSNHEDRITKLEATTLV